MSKISKRESTLFNALHDARVTANKVFNQRAFRGIKQPALESFPRRVFLVFGGRCVVT